MKYRLRSKSAQYLLAGIVIAIALMVAGPGLLKTFVGTIVSAGVADERIELGSLKPSNPGAISPPRLMDRRWTGMGGWWFEQGPGIVWTTRKSCGRLNADLESAQSFDLPYDCHDIIDLGQATDVLIALIAEGPAPFGQVAVALDSTGSELWRYVPTDSISLEAVTPLWDESGLYGIAFGPGGDEGIVALDLTGKQLWNIRPSAVLYELLTHPELPGVLVDINGSADWFTHGAGDSRSSQGSVSATGKSFASAQRQNSLVDFFYVGDGLLFPARNGDPQLLLEGSTLDDNEWIITKNRAGSRAWGIRVSDGASAAPGKIEGIALLGKSSGTTYFGVVSADGTLRVLDEDGGLLDLVHLLPTLNSKARLIVFDFSAATLSNGNHVLMASTSKGSFLIEVQLP